MLEILKKSLEYFSNGSWDDLKTIIAEDTIYEEHATQMRVSGADQYLEVLRGRRRAYPDARSTGVVGFESGDRAVVEMEWLGTQSGTLESPYGKLEASNQKVKVKACIVARFADGKIAEQHHYFDMLGLLSQVGVAVGPGAMKPGAKPAETRPAH
jgi:steroid delta-isomerase-like uncharacterized protein